MAKKDEIIKAIARVEKAVARYPSTIVAFSGGVDSSLLAYIANRVTRTLVVIGDSPSMPRRDLDDAIAFAEKFKMKYRVFRSGEMTDPKYTANAGDRCYHCKREVFGKMLELARGLGYGVVMDGTNADDLRDDRPGMKAAKELGIVSPLCEAGITKKMIREMSQYLGLQTWDRPSSPCLSSRIPVGTAVTREALARVEKAENVLRSVGFRVVRVRDHFPEARIELDVEDADRLKGIADRLRGLGYGKILISKRGYVEPQERSKKKGEDEFHEI
jgi:uncharacterized protein